MEKDISIVLPFAGIVGSYIVLYRIWRGLKFCGTVYLHSNDACLTKCQYKGHWL